LKDLIENNAFALPNAFSRSLYDKLEDGQFDNKYVSSVENDTSDDKDLEEKDYRNRKKVIHEIVKDDVHYTNPVDQFLQPSKKLDKILLHPVLGIIIFLGTILLVFQAVFFLANYPMDWIDSSFAKFGEWANNNIAIGWLADIISNGVLPGLAGVLIFIPQIAILFLLLGILEHSGYLSRISFIANRFLSNFGLTGQSVIPLMSSWACAIPAIMSSRVVNDPKERLAIIFASPLMTCSARLPVYTILIAIMIPGGTVGFFNIQGMTLMILYLIGVIATLLIAMIVSRKSNVQGNTMWSLELPVYRIPNWRNVFYNVYIKTKAFVVEAGKIIFIVSIVLWFLASFSPRKKQFITEAYETAIIENENISKEAIELEYSYAGYLGKIIEPVIAPLGYDWKIGIALISSFAAREVFVGSISTIYSVGSDDNALIKERLQREINLKTGDKRYNVATCISLLMFYVFALQCMSTMAIVRKETGSWTIPAIQFTIMLVLAYVFAFIAYRIF
ncbi:MAG: ferrous iron transporter B, partial [Saprospiraceae bacterium]|nr:ferrous iron transporter B [Saprospiraceae bacterium]